MGLLHIHDYLARNAKETPSKTALDHEGKTWTWRELAAAVDRAADFVSRQVNNDEQQVIGLLTPNTPEFLIRYLAILQAGHIAMPLDPNFKAMEVVAVCERLEPVLMITDQSYIDLLNGRPGIVLVDKLINHQLESRATGLRLPAEQQIASMLFTSGTTGNPKAVPYTHANHMWNISAVSKMWQWTADDTILLSLPLSHWHGLVMALDGALYHGNTIYLQTWFSAESTLEALESGKISLFMHVPIAYSKLIDHEPDRTFDLSGVRLCISGSSFLPPKLWHKFKERFAHDILERYGANEMGLLTSNRLDERLPGSVGYLLDGVDIKIMPDKEIAMRSPGLFSGYWQNEEATVRQRTSDGYWLSGDIGEIDDTGRLWLKGRVQEKMKKSGYTVYPRDVEWALMQHPDVQEVVVMSVQHDDELSDSFVYFVVGDITEETVVEFAKTTMPFFWRPDRIILLPEIPKTGRTSKPSLKELRALI